MHATCGGPGPKQAPGPQEKLHEMQIERGVGMPAKGNPKSLNYILWLIKELEIQIRLQIYEGETDARTRKKR